jgi:hypothetical protein
MVLHNKKELRVYFEVRGEYDLRSAAPSLVYRLPCSTDPALLRVERYIFETCRAARAHIWLDKNDHKKGYLAYPITFFLPGHSFWFNYNGGEDYEVVLFMTLEQQTTLLDLFYPEIMDKKKASTSTECERWYEEDESTTDAYDVRVVWSHLPASRWEDLQIQKQ